MERERKTERAKLIRSKIILPLVKHADVTLLIFFTYCLLIVQP